MIQRGWTFDPDNSVFDEVIPDERKPVEGRVVQAYLWSCTILCPSCTGLIPLAPNWKLSRPQKLGIELIPNQDFNVVMFQVVPWNKRSRGTISEGIAACPICGYVCKQFYPREEAQAGRMGEVQYCMVVRQWYPIYRSKGSPIQGKGPLEFVVPGDVLWVSHRERWRCLQSRGWAANAMKTHPILRDLGIFGDPPSEYAAGVEAMMKAAGISPESSFEIESN